MACNFVDGNPEQKTGKKNSRQKSLRFILRFGSECSSGYSGKEGEISRNSSKNKRREEGKVSVRQSVSQQPKCKHRGVHFPENVIYSNLQLAMYSLAGCILKLDMSFGKKGLVNS